MRAVGKTKMKSSLGVGVRQRRKGRDDSLKGTIKQSYGAFGRAAAGAIIGTKLAGPAGFAAGLYKGLTSAERSYKRQLAVGRAQDALDRVRETRRNVRAGHYGPAVHERAIKDFKETVTKARRQAPVDGMQRGLNSIGKAVRKAGRLVKRLVKRSDGHKQTYWTKSTSCKMRTR